MRAMAYSAAVMLAFTCARTVTAALQSSFAVVDTPPGYPTLARNSALLLSELASLPLLAVMLPLTPPSGVRRYAWLASVPLIICGCLAGGLAATGQSLDVVLACASTIVVAVIASTYRSAARSARAELIGHEARATQVSAELTRARLRLLQSQLEPHFLFNTLATIQALGRRDRAAAVATLDDLAHYLVDALPTFARVDNALVDEIRLVEAYLRIQSTRMGARFHYEVRLPRSVHSARVATLLVYGLVDNAIRHGIAPAIDGGRLTVTACRERSTLIVQVVDSGRGMTLTEGRSFGLASARHRLALLYGDRALLTLNGGSSTGLVATVVLPFISAPLAAGSESEAGGTDAPESPSLLRRSAHGLGRARAVGASSRSSASRSPNAAAD